MCCRGNKAAGGYCFFIYDGERVLIQVLYSRCL